MHLLRMRPATPEDLALAYTITEDAMRGYVEETWGNWDEEEQLQKHRANFTPEAYRIKHRDLRHEQRHHFGLLLRKPQD